MTNFINIMSSSIEKIKTVEIIEEKLNEILNQKWKLNLINDDFNSIEYVIVCLNRICGFNYEKAMIVTMKVHKEGSCLLMEGDLDKLQPIYESLKNANLTVDLC